MKTKNFVLGILRITTLVGFSIFCFLSSYVDAQGLSKEEQEEKKFQQEQLESLKQRDIELYTKRKRQLERQEKIEKILSDFRAGKMTQTQAENRLRPLINEQTREYIQSLDAQIADLKKEIAELENTKRKPDIYTQERINKLLGK